MMTIRLRQCSPIKIIFFCIISIPMVIYFGLFIKARFKLGLRNGISKSKQLRIKISEKHLDSVNYRKASIYIKDYDNDIVQIADEMNRESLVLPKCNPNIKLNNDNTRLETLLNCVPKGSLEFHPFIEVFKYSQQNFCDGKVVVYDGYVSVLKDVILDKSLCQSNACFKAKSNDDFTGENWEKGENLDLKRGFFKVPCVNEQTINGYIKGGRETWFDVLEAYNTSQYVEQITDRLTIAVHRFEYQNLFHTMSDVYNAFLIIKFLGIKSEDVQILLLDGNPKGVSYQIWKSIYDGISTLPDLPSTVLYRTLVWNKIGYDSELIGDPGDVPYLKELRDQFLSKLNINLSHNTNCSSIKVLFISRRDYGGRSIKRKIANEDEIMAAIKKQLSSIVINKVDFAQMLFSEQIKVVAQSDVMLGAHGAGLTHVLFLPKPSALIELIPADFNLADSFFLRMAKWRNIYYQRYVNADSKTVLDDSKSNYNPEKVVEMVANAVKKLCRS